VTNVLMGMAVTLLLPSEPMGWMDGASVGCHCSWCQGGERGGPRSREGAGRGVGLSGVPALGSSSRELEAPRSLLQQARGARLPALYPGASGA